MNSETRLETVPDNYSKIEECEISRQVIITNKMAVNARQ